MNLQQLSKDEFTCRCPECFKLFSVQTVGLKDRTARFQCNACLTVFVIDVLEALDREGLVGTKWHAQMPTATFTEAEPEAVPAAEIQQPQTEVFACPKCATSYAPGATECKKCGVVFMKWAEAQHRAKERPMESSFNASKEVKELWENALQNYEDFNGHQNFITAAWADRTLDYAAHAYGRILAVNPHDEIAQRAQKQVDALTNTRFQIEVEPEEAQNRAWLEGLNYFKDVVLSLRKIKLMTVIMVICGAIITMGLLMPDMRNLIGFGTSILFFVLALRYYFRAI